MDRKLWMSAISVACAFFVMLGTGFWAGWHMGRNELRGEIAGRILQRTGAAVEDSTERLQQLGIPTRWPDDPPPPTR